MNVLLATRGRPSLFRESLISILEAAATVNCEKIVVVENGGDFGSQSICEEVDSERRIKFVKVLEANKSIALNEGLRHCDDDLIFMTDDDVKLPKSLLSAYKEHAAINPERTFFGGPTRSTFESVPPPWFMNMLPLSARGFDPKPNDVSGDFYTFLGFNWAAYKTDLQEAGSFSPHFGPGAESKATGQESYMQRRLREIGCRGRVVPNAIIAHFVPKERCNMEWLLERAFRQGSEIGVTAVLETPQKVRLVEDELIKKLRRSTVLSFGIPTIKRRFLKKHADATLKGFYNGVNYGRQITY